MNMDEAREIVYAHEIDDTFRDKEEYELLEENNPSLLNAYIELMKIAELDIK